MDNILIKISSSLLTFNSIKKGYENLNNTNIINTKKLVFSHDFINENKELVISFLNTIIIKNKIDRIRIDDISLCTIALDLINNNSNIKKLVITEYKTITYDIFLKLLDNDYIDYINC